MHYELWTIIHTNHVIPTSIFQLMLCSTNDYNVRSTWEHLGFNYTTEEIMEHKWDIPHSDLVYLQNTVQV